MPAKTQDIEGMLDTADNLYEVVMVVAKRARQINEEYYQKKRDHQILEELEGGFDDDFLHEEEEKEIKNVADNEENPINHAMEEYKAEKLEFHYETLRR
ncbi:MAG: DNA-directed RNA polymerase subunit omega [Calditrichaeota bacterium]|nr:DNA-directed RNA polymerase subunit omega [Calditrichota bacterium]MCB0292310.1 DNA-directed RNA polymerase subunit omega [Calditrichota bacterium]MCB0306171.1 DNA-directed RNA polymerase subunit omega [Calditrichota bacterium]MCB9089956.1 DNA-directed RNA polymerase subunit omega [Calditrichia bacterium]